MIIECPKCKSTFKIAENKAIESFTKFKCSICDHIWETSTEKKEPKAAIKKNSNPSFKYILILNIIIMTFVVAAIIFYKSKLVYVDGYWRELYDFFYNLVPIK